MVTQVLDEIRVGGTALSGTEVDSFTDHRIAMSLAIAALNATGTTTIHRAEAASISYPTFVETLEGVVGNAA